MDNERPVSIVTWTCPLCGFDDGYIFTDEYEKAAGACYLSMMIRQHNKYHDEAKAKHG